MGLEWRTRADTITSRKIGDPAPSFSQRVGASSCSPNRPFRVIVTPAWRYGMPPRARTSPFSCPWPLLGRQHCVSPRTSRSNLRLGEVRPHGSLARIIALGSPAPWRWAAQALSAIRRRTGEREPLQRPNKRPRLDSRLHREVDLCDESTCGVPSISESAIRLPNDVIQDPNSLAFRYPASAKWLRNCQPRGLWPSLGLGL